MKIQRGDIFCVVNPSLLGKSIQFLEKIWAEDGLAKYGHAGIILQPTGETFEALWTIKQSYLDSYLGKQILIGRPIHTFKQLIDHAIFEVRKEHEGQWYPFWRLGLHTIPILSKWISTGGFPVCSELCVKYLMLAGVEGFGRWPGWSPDDLADAIRKWKFFDVIYEGKLTCDILS